MGRLFSLSFSSSLRTRFWTFRVALSLDLDRWLWRETMVSRSEGVAGLPLVWSRQYFLASWEPVGDGREEME